MSFGKKKFFALTMAVVMMFGFMGAIPGLQQNAQAATVVEQRLQDYMNANPAGGAAYNCMTFAKQVFKYVFGYDAAGIDYHGNYRSDCTMNVTNRIGNANCGQMQGQVTTGINAATMRDVATNAQPGDIIEAMTGSHGKHTMVLVSANDTGLTVYHGNWNGRIAYTTFSYEKFVAKWSHAVTVYHATNYDFINNPLNATPAKVQLEVTGLDKMTPAVYEIGGANYYSLNDVAYLMKDTPLAFGVTTEGGLTLLPGEANAAVAEPAQPGIMKACAKPGAGNLKVGAETFKSDYYVIDGNVYIPIRELANALDFTVDWDETEQCATISFMDELTDDLFDNSSKLLQKDHLVTV